MREYGSNKIFVEGTSDKLFIDFILDKYFGIINDEIVVATMGKDKLVSQPDLTNTRRIEENAKNLVIFDTDLDNEKSKGGRGKRIEEYNNVAKTLNTSFLIYLLPFDNEEEGILENLLSTCFKKNFNYFDKCWSGMVDCLRASELEKLNIPAQKALVYSKIDLFKNYREREWGYASSSKYDYFDEGIWDLEIGNNPNLKKLVEFIDQNLFN
jgi:hypothetical protein